MQPPTPSAKYVLMGSLVRVVLRHALLAETMKYPMRLGRIAYPVRQERTAVVTWNIVMYVHQAFIV